MLRADETKLLLTIYQGDQELRSIEPDNPLRLPGDAETGHPIVLRVPTSNLPAGRYRIEVGLSDTARRRRATGEIELSIE